MQTLPLPADASSKETYFAKGFRLTNPADEPQPQVDTEKEDLKAEVARLQKALEAKPKVRRKRAKSD
jgi:hypothetical protein